MRRPGRKRQVVAVGPVPEVRTKAFQYQGGGMQRNRITGVRTEQELHHCLIRPEDPIIELGGIPKPASR